jgi:hypothetical protein
LSKVFARISSTKGLRVSGWAWDQEKPTEPATLTFQVDGKALFRTRCDRPRKDAASVGAPSERVGFNCSLPLHVLDGQRHHIALLNSDGSIAVEREIVTDRFRISADGQPEAFGCLERGRGAQVSGWAVLRSADTPSVIEAPAKISIFVDDRLQAVVAPSTQVAVEGALRDVGFEFRLPARFWDGSPHTIEAVIMSAAGAMSVGRLVLPPQAAPENPRAVGEVFGARGTAIQGRLAPGMISRDAELVLKVGGVETARSRSGADGSFEIDVAGHATSDWLTQTVAVEIFPDQLVLAYAGHHLVSDAISITILRETGTEISGTIESGVALVGELLITAMAGGIAVGSWSSVCTSPVNTIAFSLNLEEPLPQDTEAKLVLNGIEVRQVRSQLLSATPAPAEPRDPRTPARLVDPSDPGVALALERLVVARSDRAPAHDPLQPPVSGSWRFVPPGCIEGWAIDLATPERPLKVELWLENELAGVATARDLALPIGAGVACEVGIGFSLDLQPGHRQRRLIALKVAGSDIALPGPASVWMSDTALEPGITPETEASLVAEAEGHVKAGKLALALVTLSDPAAARSRRIAERAAILNAALRTDWHGHAKVLEDHRGLVGEDLRQILEDHSRSRASGSPKKRSSDQLKLLGYGAFAGLLDDAPARDEAGPSTSHLLWLSLQSLPRKSLRLEPGLSRLSYVQKVIDWDELDGHLIGFLGELARSGCQVHLAAPDPAAQPAEAKLQELQRHGIRMLPPLDEGRSGSEELRPVTVIAQEPRLYSVEALSFLPGLMEAGHVPDFRAIEVSDYTRSAEALAIIGTMRDDRTVALHGASHAQLAPIIAGSGQEAVPATEPAFAVTGLSPARSTSPRCHVIHDLDDPGALPLLPRAATIHHLETDQSGRFQDQDRLRQIVEGIAADVPVVLISKHLEYPADYLRHLVRLHRSFRSNSSLSTAPIEYAELNEEFSFSSPASNKNTHIALAASSCMRADQLRSALALAPLRSPLDLILLPDRPLRTLSLLGTEKASHNSATLEAIRTRLSGSVDARQLGFAALALRSRGLDPLASYDPDKQKETRLLALARSQAIPASDLLGASGEELLQIALTSASEADAVNVLMCMVTNSQWLSSATGRNIEVMLRAAAELGVQAEVAAVLAPLIPECVSRAPEQTIQLFNLMATSLNMTDLSSLVLATAHIALLGSAVRPAARLLDVCRRFCPPSTLLMLLLMVDRSSHRALLNDPKELEAIGGALLRASIWEFVLPQTGLTFDHFRRHAPLNRLLIASILDGSPLDFGRLLRQFLAQGGAARDLVLLLRTYSAELTKLLRDGPVPDYRSLVPPEYLLSVAALLDDRTYIREALQSAEPIGDRDVDMIVAATYTGDFGPFNNLSRALWKSHDVDPVELTGSSISEVFASVEASCKPSERAVHSGKVSVIMTVFEPDLALLEKSIASILEQTYQDLEILLVDDASEIVDGEQIAQVAQVDPRIRHVRLSRNGGPYVARNRALQMSNGMFVAIQDGDDYSHPQRLAKQVEVFSRSSAIQMCTASHVRIDALGRLQYEHNFHIYGDGTMTSMFRKSVFDDIGGFAPVRTRGDVEFREHLKRSYGKHAIVHLDCPLQFCYASPSTLSNTAAQSHPDYLRLYRSNVASLRPRRRSPLLGPAPHARRAQIPPALRGEN